MHQIRRKAAIVGRKRALFGGMNLDGDIAPNKVEKFEKEKAALHEEIICLQKDLDKLKEKRKSTPKHISFAQLPEEHKFKGLSTKSKHFIDTIKMIAYRAETAMSLVLRDWMARGEDTRSLLRSIYSTEADIIPDKETGTLRVRLHHLATHSADETLRKLCNFLNETETRFPGTNLRLVYELVSSQNPRDQES